ncbi:MAG: hypothetical protein MJZ74_04910 [Muribaculaceae bacterium]|nr:hypothetical protein [Muribaculaceae bacterium]
MVAYDKLNDIFNGKLFLAASWFAMMLASIVAATSGEVVQQGDGNGIFFDISSSYVGSPGLSMTINVLLVTAIGVLMLMLNKVFNFVRSVTDMLASAFFLLTMSNPLTCCAFNAGTALTLVLALGAFYTFGSYNDKHAQRSIFLTFTIITFCALFQWAFVVLLPAFFIGFCYMRTMNWRSFMATLLGIFVPFWIVLGTGMASPFDFKPIATGQAWATLEPGQLRMMIVSVCVTVVAVIAITAANLYTIINYRLQLRVYNVFFMVMSILTIIAMVVDYHDMHIFIPILNLCLAVQFSHAYTISTFTHRYIYVIVLIVWSIVSCTGILYM